MFAWAPCTDEGREKAALVMIGHKGPYPLALRGPKASREAPGLRDLQNRGSECAAGQEWAPLTENPSPVQMEEKLRWDKSVGAFGRCAVGTLT